MDGANRLLRSAVEEIASRFHLRGRLGFELCAALCDGVGGMDEALR